MATRNVNGVTIFYTDRGRGTPLVLVHGFPLDWRMWEAQVAELSSRCRVIAPDLRGFGHSRSDAPFTIESQADDLHVLLDEVGALPCVLAGLSMGGYIALAHARKYGVDLRGLVLVDTKAEGDTPEQKEGRQKMIELVRTNGSKAVAEQMLPKMLSADALRNRPAVVQTLRTIMETCPPTTIENALVAMRDRPDQTPYLASISVPALIVVGEADAITPPAVAQAMQRRIPRSQLVTITGAGHMSPIEQPAQVNRPLSRFVDALSQG